MSKQRSKNRSRKTYIEYGFNTSGEGGGFHLIVESYEPEVSERIFNRICKKLPQSSGSKPPRSMGVV